MVISSFVTTIEGLPSARPSIQSQICPPLASDKIYELSKLFIKVRAKVILEHQAIASEGFTVGTRPYLNALVELEGSLDQIIRRLDAIAFSVLIQMDLATFNKEIIGSTQRLNQAAAQLRKIRDNIRKFIVIVDDVLAIVTKISTGGTFDITGVFKDVTTLLEDLGLKLPELPITT